MNTLDNFSKRILIIAVSISLVLLSFSAFLFTIQQVTATPKQPQPNLPSVVGLGVNLDTALGPKVGYYMQPAYNVLLGGYQYSVQTIQLPR